MRVVALVASVDGSKCTGCGICEKVCVTLAIAVRDRLAVVDPDRCMGCGACEQRCPPIVIKMVPRVPRVHAVDPTAVEYGRVDALCRSARMHPEQVVCYCTGTRAEEVAAAILQGAHSPEELSFRTGVRTGCKVECIEPVLRLLEAAGVELARPRGWQWYGRTPTVFKVPPEVRRKYAGRGFYFDQDERLLEKVASSPLTAKGGSGNAQEAHSTAGTP